jgi:hypothetical protein
MELFDLFCRIIYVRRDSDSIKFETYNFKQMYYRHMCANCQHEKKTVIQTLRVCSIFVSREYLTFVTAVAHYLLTLG